MAEAAGIEIGSLHFAIEVGDVGIGIEGTNGVWDEIQGRWKHIPLADPIEKWVYRAGEFATQPEARQLDIKWDGIWYDIGDDWWLAAS